MSTLQNFSELDGAKEIICSYNSEIEYKSPSFSSQLHNLKQNKAKILIDKHNFATRKTYTDIFIEAYFSF